MQTDPESNVIPLHRGSAGRAVTSIPLHHLGIVEGGVSSDPIETLRGHLREYPIRSPLVDRIADALGSRMFLPCYVSFVAGALFTAGMALLWARVL